MESERETERQRDTERQLGQVNDVKCELRRSETIEYRAYI